MTRADELVAKADQRDLVFGIIGLGYVGLPLAVEWVKAGYQVLGFDVDPKVVAGLERGESHVKDVSHEELQKASIRLTQLKCGISGELKISAVTSAKFFVPHLLGAFHKLYPEVKFKME